MNTRARTSHQPMRYPLKRDNNKMEAQGRPTSLGTEKSFRSRVQSSKQKKISLLQDVDKLKKKLKHEENIHRALERAFSRPLGVLPRLPPYLPLSTQELLAEIAVLEEEVVRLEEQVVNCRQGLYQEAIYISSKRKMELQYDLPEQLSSKTSRQHKARDDVGVDLATLLEVSHRSFARSAQAPTADVFDEMEQPTSGSATIMSWKQSSKEPNRPSASSDEGQGGIEDRAYLKDKPLAEKKPSNPITQNLMRMPDNSPRAQPESQGGIEQERASSENKALGGDSEPNKISEDVLKCLCSIFMRLCTAADKTPKMEIPSSLVLPMFKDEKEPEFPDPYGSGADFKERDIGCYKHLCVIEAGSIDFKRKRNALFLSHKLKLLLGKLASVSLDGLTHHHKLAFWINTYNSCMLNAFLEHGVPERPETVVALMREATIVVGGQMLNALTIEHFILRLPFYLQYVCPKGAKLDDFKARSAFGLEWSEPLVTFALSCGSWSSPAVRVYTASQVESELIAAKRDYLQAAIGILNASNKLRIPKLLDWYLLDFAKDLESLLDWVCLQLPDQQRKETLEFLERNGREPLSQLVQVVPYDFTFRYLLRP